MNFSIKANIILAYLSFILSGILIFSPLHKSDNIIVSVFSAFISAFLCLLLILHVFRKKKNGIPPRFLAVISSLLSSFCCLMLITEIIKDVSFVTGRGISLFYYAFISVTVLSVSLYLCLSKDKGIFRFCILSAVLFMFLLFISFSGFATTKSFVFERNSLQTNIISSAVRGTLTGLFLTADSSLFFYCFDNFIRAKDGTVYRRSILTAFFTAFFLIISYNLSTSFIFGQKLTSALSDPDYALAKLLPGIDFTETISALRIVSFLIKSSVYFFCTAKVCENAFGSKKFSFNKITLVQYLLLPIVVAILLLIDKNLEYGAFQSLIYPAVILISLIFIIIYTFFQK